jgi:predicted dienelactone hydrolase
MYALEAISALTILVFLVAQVSRGVDRRISIAAGAAGLVTIGLLFALRQARWQMAPLFLLWAVLSLSLLKRSPAHVVLRAIGAVLGLAVVGVGLVLSLGFPVVELPAPEGPYAVGSTAFTLVDDSRDESGFGAPKDRRELYVRLWYPASARSQDPPDADRASRPLTLWHELYRGEQDLFTRMGGYLAGVDTSSYEDAPLAADIDSVPVILFSHGMLGHAEQNTLLMEHLASHGYLVAAIGHSYLSMRVNLSGGRSVGAHL